MAKRRMNNGDRCQSTPKICHRERNAQPDLFSNPTNKAHMKNPLRYLVLNRTGDLIATRSLNQCRAVNTPVYHYHAQLVFTDIHGSSLLDGQQYVVPHELVDETLQKLSWSGSCEQVALQAATALNAVMRAYNRPMVAIRVTIHATIPGQGPAWMEHTLYTDPNALRMLK